MIRHNNNIFTTNRPIVQETGIKQTRVAEEVKFLFDKDKKQKIAGVYAIVVHSDNDKISIGSSSDIERRMTKFNSAMLNGRTHNKKLDEHFQLVGKEKFEASFHLLYVVDVNDKRFGETPEGNQKREKLLARMEGVYQRDLGATNPTKGYNKPSYLTDSKGPMAYRAHRTTPHMR